MEVEGFKVPLPLLVTLPLALVLGPRETGFLAAAAVVVLLLDWGLEVELEVPVTVLLLPLLSFSFPGPKSHPPLSALAAGGGGASRLTNGVGGRGVNGLIESPYLWLICVIGVIGTVPFAEGLARKLILGGCRGVDGIAVDVVDVELESTSMAEDERPEGGGTLPLLRGFIFATIPGPCLPLGLEVELEREWVGGRGDVGGTLLARWKPVLVLVLDLIGVLGL